MNRFLTKFYNSINNELSKKNQTTHQLLTLDLDELKNIVPKHFFCLFSGQELKRFKRYQDSYYFSGSVCSLALLRMSLLCLLKQKPKRFNMKAWSEQEAVLNEKHRLFFDYTFSQQLASVLITHQRSTAIGLQHHQGLNQQLALSKRFFSPAEWAIWLSNSEQAQTQYFFDAFIAKMTLAKAMGPRHFCNISHIEVLDTSHDPVLVCTGENDNAAKTWRLHFLNLKPRYSLCVCSQYLQGSCSLTKLNLS